MWIGEKKIKGVLDVEDGYVKVGFKDNAPDAILKKNLYDMIITEEKRNGTVTDVVRKVLAFKFLEEMANLGLEFYMAEHVGQGIATLAHNMREEVVAKKFGCKSLLDIKLSDLVNYYEAE